MLTQNPLMLGFLCQFHFPFVKVYDELSDVLRLFNFIIKIDLMIYFKFIKYKLIKFFYIIPYLNQDLFVIFYLMLQSPSLFLSVFDLFVSLLPSMLQSL